jgi:alpha-tubulin suppressor-like RCC1 family protein
VDNPALQAVLGNHSFESLSAGAGHVCGLVAGGTAYCWGSNQTGALGDGTNADAASPVMVTGGLSFSQISASQYFFENHTCAVTPSGDGYCWGNNSYGELGNGTTTGSNQPVLVAGGHKFIAIEAGWNSSCGLTTGGEVWCWGRNLFGKLGDGSGADSAVPVEVVDPS